MTDSEKTEFEFLATQKELEKVSPCLEIFRNTKYRNNIAYGGRGAGAKSWGFDSLIVQEAHRTKVRVACFREIQQSLKESSYQNIYNMVNRLRYPGWKFLNESIKSPSGSYFIFRGLKDMRASQQIKSYEGFDLFRIEEAAPISQESWDMVMPTLRKKGSRFYITFNPENENDPVMDIFINSKRDDTLSVFCRPEELDNPWWNETALPGESKALKERDYDEWLHQYGGEPRKQGQNSVMSRVLVDQAMHRDIEPEGMFMVGCDPADFGDDKTEIYVRKGLKIIKHKEIKQMNGIYIANEIANMINRDPTVQINLDTTGIGTSTRDQLKALGLKVNAINFSQSAINKNKYDNFSTELWFNFKENYLDKCSIPNDNELKQELSSRIYGYTHENKYCVEKKNSFKSRLGRSPDKADALLLCFYSNPISFNNDFKKQMTQRYAS